MTSASEKRTTAKVGLPGPDDGDLRVVLNLYYDGGVHVAELVAGCDVIVGRSEPADITLPVQSLSRQHARFVRDGDQTWVEDLGSRNGVLLRSQAVQRARIEPGSIVQLGDVRAVVYQLGAAQGGGSVRRDTADPGVQTGKATADEGDAPHAPVVRSACMRTLQHQLLRVAATDMPVIIVGETGAGKELVAQSIHRASNRKYGPFCAVNCGAIPDSLLTSLLFGHEKGAFTGANQASKGLFEQAQGGTVFLDEIGELSASTQAALLRVLETQRVTRLGSHAEIVLNTRVIAATHRDLDAMTRAGTFRSDLLFRLNAFVLTVPPLRQRREEILPLAEHFVRAASGKFQLPFKAVDEAASAALLAYAWPGNVRELRNVVEHALVMCEGPSIGARDLPERVQACSTSADTVETAAPVPDHRSPLPAFESEGYRDLVREYEVGLILHGLRVSNGNQTQAAQLLKLPLRTLVHKIKHYGIREAQAAE